MAEGAGNEWESVLRKDDRGGRAGGGAERVAAMLTNNGTSVKCSRLQVPSLVPQMRDQGYGNG